MSDLRHGHVRPTSIVVLRHDGDGRMSDGYVMFVTKYFWRETDTVGSMMQFAITVLSYWTCEVHGSYRDHERERV